jgi:phage-related protein
MTAEKAIEKIITVRFFKTPAGNEPVRDWLKKQTAGDKKAISEDIKAVEFLWPLEYPQVTKPDRDLWDAGTDLADRICRVFFTVTAGFMVLLHGIVKKDRKTPTQDLELAEKRRYSVSGGGFQHE